MNVAGGQRDDHVRAQAGRTAVAVALVADDAAEQAADGDPQQ